MKAGGVPAWLGKLSYGALFVIVLPLLLYQWSAVLDRSWGWRVPAWPILAAGLALGGGAVMLMGMRDLARYGQGLPMNAYPPPQLVTAGIYAWFAHPIYLGATLLAGGAALWFRSSAGLLVVTPVLAFSSVSLWLGYERLAMHRRFGEHWRNYQPHFALPSSTGGQVGWEKRGAMMLRVFLPWLGAVALFATHHSAGTLGSAVWRMEIFWSLPMLYPLWWLLRAKEEPALRQATIAGTIATAGAVYVRLVFPGSTAGLLSPGWALLLSSGGIVLLARHDRWFWSALQRGTEWVANSRREWLFAGGRFRIINHALYSGLGGAVGAGICGYVMGNDIVVTILIVCILLGGAIIAQVWWGGAHLLRPFGFWGAIVGGAIGVGIIYLFFDIPFAQLALGAALCAPFAQALGRLRCLVQGCCHGVETDNRALGIRVWQPQSRVVVHSRLQGAYLLNTPLFSILFNLLLGFGLWRLWRVPEIGCWVVVGGYCLLTGIERFTEDAYRGEGRVRMRCGLRENQWVALLAIFTGILISWIPAPNVPLVAAPLRLSTFFLALGGGLLTAFAMSMDFPQSTRRFSRLSG